MPYLILLASLSSAPAALAVEPTSAEAVSNKTQAAQRAQQQVKGRILRVEQRETSYRVKLLQKSGRVVTVDIKRVTRLASPVQPPMPKEP